MRLPLCVVRNSIEQNRSMKYQKHPFLKGINRQRNGTRKVPLQFDGHRKRLRPAYCLKLAL